MTQNLFSRTTSRLRNLSPRINALIAFVLGIGAGASLQHKTLNFLSIFAILMVVLLTNLNKFRFSVIAGYLSFLIGLSSVIIIFNDSGSITGSSGLFNSLIQCLMIFTGGWAILQLLAYYAKTTWRQPYGYWQHTIVWSIIFFFSLGFKYFLGMGIVLLILVKFYQVFFITEWTKPIKKAFAFSLLFPLTLLLVSEVYARYYASNIYEKAEKIEQEVLSYYDKHGEYPSKEMIGTDEKPRIFYRVNDNGEPHLSYSKPMTIGIIMKYDFEKEEWVEEMWD